MHAEARARYDLEGLWNDAKLVNPPKPRKKKTPAE
jgi:ribosomal silencing factor RsfS